MLPGPTLVAGPRQPAGARRPVGREHGARPRLALHGGGPSPRARPAGRRAAAGRAGSGAARRRSRRSVVESRARRAESIITYRRRYAAGADVATVLELLLLDRDNPRSVAHQLDRLADSLAPRAAQRTTLRAQASSSSALLPRRGGFAAARRRPASRGGRRPSSATFLAELADGLAPLARRDRAARTSRTCSHPAARRGHRVSARAYQVTHRTDVRATTTPVNASHGRAHLLPRDEPASGVLIALTAITPTRRTRRTSTSTTSATAPPTSASRSPHRDARRSPRRSRVEVDRARARLVGDGRAPWEPAPRASSSDERRRPARARAGAAVPDGRRASRSVAAYAAAVLPAGRPLGEALRDLLDRDRTTTSPTTPGATTISTPLDDRARRARGRLPGLRPPDDRLPALAGLAGALRQRLPARPTPPPGRARLVGADASHAWVSVLVPGARLGRPRPDQRPASPTSRYIVVGAGTRLRRRPPAQGRDLHQEQERAPCTSPWTCSPSPPSCSRRAAVRVFHCDHCGQVVFFGDDLCLRCQSPLGFDHERGEVVALTDVGDGRLLDLTASTRSWQRCATRAQTGCTWLVPAHSNALCASCALTRTRPADSDDRGPGRVGAAPRRPSAGCCTSCCPWACPSSPRDDEPAGLAFDLLSARRPRSSPGTTTASSRSTSRRRTTSTASAVRAPARRAVPHPARSLPARDRPLLLAGPRRRRRTCSTPAGRCSATTPATTARRSSSTTPRATTTELVEHAHQPVRHHAPVRGLGRDLRPLPAHPGHPGDGRQLRPRAAGGRAADVRRDDRPAGCGCR